MIMSTYILLLTISVLSSTSDAVECESGWTAYKDELCIKSFPNLLTWDEAKSLCSSQGSSTSLVMIKDSDMQELVANYTSAIYDNLWLGGKYDEDSEQFLWDDGEPVTYTNWQEGYPRNVTDSEEVCIELRPRNSKESGLMSEGKWADALCKKRNLVLCQRVLAWTLEDAIGAIIQIRKQHQNDLDVVNERLQITEQYLEATQQVLQSTRRELEETQQDLQVVTSKVVPVGSIYIEYYDQPSPRSLWPTMTWQDISISYAGLFFRVLGSASGNWGTTQSECAPRISEVEFYERSSGSFPRQMSIPTSGWSGYGQGGAYSTGGGGTWYNEAVRYYTNGCEIRPRNQAVRIWKRTV